MTERYALAVLYYSTSGNSWWKKNNWLSSSDHCTDWTKMSCDVDGKVDTITLHVNNLIGTLPTEISALESIYSMMFYNNRITGSVPANIYNLPLLKLIDVQANLITGKTFVPEMFTYDTLEEIKFGYNDYLQSETIPAAIASLTNLRRFLMTRRNLIGTIPDLSPLTKLEQIYLDYNSLTGTMPNAIFHLPLIKSLYLEYNVFTGTVQSTASETLTAMILSENLLTGTIPTEISALTKLITLRIAGGSGSVLTGSIPPEFNLMTDLRILDLDNNSLTGTIPDFTGTEMNYLKLSFNELTGTLPDHLFVLPTLASLWLDDNKLTGPIPLSFTSAPGLTRFDLDLNGLTGTIPAIGPGQLTDLYSFSVQRNDLTGAIPQGICDLKATGLRHIEADCLSEISCPSDCCTACY